MIAAKPRGKGAHLVHYYKGDKDIDGLFTAVCRPSRMAYKAANLRFRPDEESGYRFGVWSHICRECIAIKAQEEAELAHA